MHENIVHMTERVRNRAPVHHLHSELSAQGILSGAVVGRQFRRRSQHKGCLSAQTEKRTEGGVICLMEILRWEKHTWPDI